MTTKKSAIIKEILIPIKQMKFACALIVFCSVVVSLCQAVVIFIFGPLFKALFQAGESSLIELSQVLPAKLAETLNLSGVKWPAADFFALLPLLLLSIGVIRGLALYLLNINQERVSLEVAHYIRWQSFRRILQTDYIDISKKGAGQWMSQIMNDIMILQQRFTDLLKSLVKDGLTVAGAILALAFININMTLGIIGICLPAIFFLGIGSKKIAHYTEVIQKKIGELSAMVSDQYSRLGDISVHRAQLREWNQFQEQNSILFQQQKRSITLRSSFAPSIELLGFLVFAAVLYLYSSGYFSEGFSPTYLMQFVIALGICIRPLRNLGEQISKLQETKGSMKSNWSIGEASRAKLPAGETQASFPIELQSASVGYGSDPVVTIESMHLKDGQSTLLKGESGCGKSTVLKTLAGLLVPESWKGSCTWNQLSASSAYVSQNPFLFDGSMAENIFYGQKNSKLKRLKALEIAQNLQLGEVLASEADFDKMFSSYESELSGGQKQRLTILRALMAGKTLLLLDEATSALDPSTESLVLAFLRSWVKDKGGHLIFISHRAHKQSDFDQSFLIENGKWLSA
ncbi:ABC transporter ATP-binding protein/permease [Oligoflexaceae bacterium]|nr:ABC transporter ATP-binding protein/permease [Oligoflexaceae bacterium]